MLDVDGSGWLSKQEFVGGVMRLIYCNSFQRDCLAQCAFGRLQQANVQMHSEITKCLRSATEHIMKEILQLREEFQIATGRGASTSAEDVSAFDDRHALGHAMRPRRDGAGLLSGEALVGLISEAVQASIPSDACGAPDTKQVAASVNASGVCNDGISATPVDDARTYPFSQGYPTSPNEKITSSFWQPLEASMINGKYLIGRHPRLRGLAVPEDATSSPAGTAHASDVANLAVVGFLPLVSCPDAVSKLCAASIVGERQRSVIGI